MVKQACVCQTRSEIVQGCLWIVFLWFEIETDSSWKTSWSYFLVDLQTIWSYSSEVYSINILFSLWKAGNTSFFVDNFELCSQTSIQLYSICLFMYWLHETTLKYTKDLVNWKTKWNSMAKQKSKDIILKSVE